MMRRALLVASRELLAERRHADGLVSALTFTALLVVLESLTLGPGRAREPQTAASLYWIAVLFAAVLVAGHLFERELEDDAIDAILVMDGGREALYAGVTMAMTTVVAIVAVAGGALSLLLLDLEVALPVHLAAVAVLGVASLPPVVVLVNLLSLRLRTHAALVPILAFPLLVPQLIGASQGTSAALSGDALTALGWSGLLAAFATIYTVLGLTVAPGAFD